MMNLLAILCPILVWAMISQRGSALLIIRQGRTASDGRQSVVSVVGIATVELGGSPANQPTYYFECITNRNNGSGIRWSRMSAQHRFQVVDIPDGSPGKRLDVEGISYPDLDIYTCSDRYSNDVTSVNITAFNPAIMAAEETVGVVEGLTVQLEVYVSGYPSPSSSRIRWYYPNGAQIADDDVGVRFLESKRRLVLSNVRSQQAGVYTCDVVISVIPYMGASTEILLEVYVPPTFMSQPQETLDAAEWMEVTLNCSASGSPTPLIRWEREGGAQLPVGAMIASSTNGNKITSMLTFGMIRYEDRGRYWCVADNIQTNPVTSQYADIRVTPALRLTDERMQSVSDLYSVENGAQLRLECFGTGNLQWTSSTGLEISSDESGNIYRSYDHTRDALTLVIQNFTNSTIATYTCMTDLTDAHDSPITISVLITSYNPAVIIQSQVQYVLPNRSTTLEARVFASPLDQAVVQWYHRGRLIDDNAEIPYTASSNGDLYRLTVNSVSGNEVGEYSIVVSLNGLRASDRITVLFSESPSATIAPSSVTVSEGDEVTLTCEAQGSRPLTVTWTMSDGSPLPVGVQENGNTLLIVSATRAHPGTYVCSVSNLAGTSQDEVVLIVFYSPKAVISYNGTLSTLGEQLYLTFNDGASGPTITCSAGGHLPPTVEWIKDNTRGLPHGILQQNAPGSNGVAGVQLKWQREMDFTDSGTYVCHASNNNGTDSATLELLVKIEPTIDSIYPSSTTIEQDSAQTLSFTVPTDYVGRTLTCTANGWPVPVVEWHRNNVPVPSNNGIISETTTTSATVSARLTWMRGFLDTDAGSYQCVVYKPNTAIPVTSQTVLLSSRLPTTISPTHSPCGVQEVSIHFQIRVFSTNCKNWGEVQKMDIASEFRDELQSVVRTECDCTFDESDLQVLGPAECSSKVNGAAVFRGRIETSSLEDTERIFCSLYSWQQKSPLVRISDQFRAVDRNCSLEAGISADSEECVAPIDPSTALGVPEVVAIAAAGGVAGLIVFTVIVSLLCCVGCCYWCRKTREGKDDPKDDHVYTRTESFSRYSRDTVGMSRNERHPQGVIEEESLYSTLAREATIHQSPRHNNQESTRPGLIRSTSRENLIISDNIDGLTRIPSRSRTQRTPEAYQIPMSSRENLASLSILEDSVAGDTRSRAQQTPGAYQIPVRSQENLSMLGRLEDSVNIGKVQSGKRHVSATSSYDSTSHLLNKMANPRPSISSIDDAANDYEEISEDDDSLQNSPPFPGRKHGRPSVGSVHVSHQMTDSRKHSDARLPPTFFLGENSPQLGETRAELGRTVKTASTQLPSTQASSRPLHPSETTTVTPSSQQAHHTGNGSHTTDGSPISPHMTKQEIITQLKLVGHVQESHPRAALEPPPPYTSRPSSEAVEYASESCGSSMVDNAAYEDVSRQLLPWYRSSSDASLNSRTATHSNAREQIQPYAMINNEHIPQPGPSHSAPCTLPTERSRELRSGNRQRRNAEFRVHSPEQQYGDERGTEV